MDSASSGVQQIGFCESIGCEMFGKSYPSTMGKTNRVVHLTFQKCGSQWVAHMLGDPEISALSGMSLQMGGVDLCFSDWPPQPAASFMAPLYGASFADWQANRSDGDKAVVVIRDPRDVAISLVYSLSYSHWPGAHVTLIRERLLSLDLRRRIYWGIEQIFYKQKALFSWAGRPASDSELVVSYEDLVNSPEAEFGRLLSFLKWDVPPDVLRRVLKRHSFAERSGRPPGEEDVFSHYRKGLPGDWKRHFDKGLGRMWEEIVPGLVRSLGYESDDRWYEVLPEESNAGALPAPDAQVRTAVEVQAEIARVREENLELRRSIAAFQEHSAALALQLSQQSPSPSTTR
jgi:hypothetical protein